MISKQLAGEKAVEFIKADMTIGLGTGSTVYWTIHRLGKMVKNGLQIRAIPTSKQTESLAKELGIPMTSFSEVSQLDLTIDGADEIDTHFNLIKGGGGALLREKLVAAASKRFIIAADDSNLVHTLGKFPLPVEVVPFAWEVTAQRIASLNCKPVLRMNNKKPYITDNGNFILDCSFEKIENPLDLSEKLKLIPGVVETGLFIDMADLIIVGSKNDIRLINKN
ncbi:ribose-5-phosphate isomerase RpiA [Paenactinomyces guangxiensis]|uniref:Ribose-5-phosphate isomerase A n=1 Tax=Paenactinomyces guangxiensis TaxID=1490290 RepID=A0A7W2A975_9BACL|nr:ribose-5-phosphate isomerase RpiA [Paenactinomyces guangxiensis]MBA4494929.1 ribose-5-phosphate isomerase RpiA [Paenactinomyces guangxiensis]MBH8592012.1 ribose-5-phosphate isomerase RpiA [Paenactinomyces guangxiensis]